MRNFHRFINVVKRPHFKSGIGYLKISQESLDDPQYRNENSGLKYEFFKDDNAESPNTESIDIFVLFSELEEHEKFVVNKYYFEYETYDNIGAQMNKSGETVRQYLNIAKNKMRRSVLAEKVIYR